MISVLAPLPEASNARKTLAWINRQAGTTVQGHGLRSTFTSIAEELVSGGILKRLALDRERENSLPEAEFA